ncbi:MAG: AI-2E family transporter [Clostridiales bacterium]|jgi:predicted PurR-regulated permease PerM|nr:AI-2E family transporter [Clostridiales bacterium]
MKKLADKYKILILGAVLLAAALYVKDVFRISASVLKAFSPIFIGVLFALILNIILNFFEKKVFTFKKSKHKKWKRPINLFMTYLVFFGIAGGVIALAVPHIIRSLNSLAERLPSIVEGLPERLKSIADSLGIPDAAYEKILSGIQNGAAGFSDKLIDAIPKIIEFSKNMFRSLYNFITGLVLSGFILGCKEKLVNQFRRILSAFLSNKNAERVFGIIVSANKKLSRFLAGQTFECFVVGIGCFVLMLIFKIPYAALVSVIIGLTNFIPMIGPTLGTIPSALIIMIDSPVKALYFIIIENIVQQLEGTFLYPKVVGSKLGISGLWVFASVLVLGNLFGFLGLFLGVPLFACLYHLFAEIVKERKARNELSSELLL